MENGFILKDEILMRSGGRAVFSELRSSERIAYYVQGKRVEIYMLTGGLTYRHTRSIPIELAGGVEKAVQGFEELIARTN